MAAFSLRRCRKNECLFILAGSCKGQRPLGFMRTKKKRQLSSGKLRRFAYTKRYNNSTVVTRGMIIQIGICILISTLRYDLSHKIPLPLSKLTDYGLPVQLSHAFLLKILAAFSLCRCHKNECLFILAGSCKGQRPLGFMRTKKKMQLSSGKLRRFGYTTLGTEMFGVISHFT